MFEVFAALGVFVVFVVFAIRAVLAALAGCGVAATQPSATATVTALTSQERTVFRETIWG
ncbi:hypothetical protein [Streptosporangium vulgare]|uniref:Uncharacterized protein n=1 Tax=Streptosporangium vulgare TaxID=46190 RepID=A0ABV5TJV9_9ACTN